MWTRKLQDNYTDLQEFQQYDTNYGLVHRLGFTSARTAWEANPTIQGSTNPADFKVIDDPGSIGSIGSIGWLAFLAEAARIG